MTGAAGLAALSDSLCADTLRLPHQLSFVEAVLASTKRHSAGSLGARIIDRALFDQNIRRRYVHGQEAVQAELAEHGTGQCEQLGRLSWQKVRLGLEAN